MRTSCLDCKTSWSSSLWRKERDNFPCYHFFTHFYKKGYLINKLDTIIISYRIKKWWRHTETFPRKITPQVVCLQMARFLKHNDVRRPNWVLIIKHKILQLFLVSHSFSMFIHTLLLYTQNIAHGLIGFWLEGREESNFAHLACLEWSRPYEFSHNIGWLGAQVRFNLL